MKRYIITANKDGIKVSIEFVLLSFLNRMISIPVNIIHFIRTNRVENNFFVLVLGIDSTYQIPDMGSKVMMALNHSSRENLASRFIKNEKTNAHYGPGIFVLHGPDFVNNKNESDRYCRTKTDFKKT